MHRQACVARLTPLAPGAAVAATDAIVFESRGVALVVGDDASVAPHAAALARALNVVVCAPGVQEVAGLPRGVVAIGGRIAAITGHLGAFTARAVTGPGASAELGAFSPNADHAFDLVLDLSSEPHFPQPLPPLGYFAPGDDPAAVAQAIAAMPALVGRFAKPRYFEFTPALCAHGAKGKTGCTRCLDVCSTAAIRSGGDVVAVDPYLCQGCATCTLACPTGALSFRHPARGDLVAHIAFVLEEARANGVAAPVLVVHAPALAETVRGSSLPAEARTIEVTSLPAFGEELWLTALAQGAAGVVLVTDATLPRAARTLLDERLAVVRSLIDAVGARGGLVAAVALDAVHEAVAVAAAAANSATRVTMANPRARKRTLLFAGLDTLAQGRISAPVPLPAGTPFGNVDVDRNACTLCHACVNLCPTSALVAETAPVPKLLFIEVNCVQCGLCEVGCPEHAITLRPRIATDPVARNAARLLHEDELAHCTSCGTPFIGRTLLASSLARLKDFPGLTDAGGIDRLKLCPACRQHAALEL